jgi:hypothetical protein
MHRIAFFILIFVLSACNTQSDKNKNTSQTRDSLQSPGSARDSGKKSQNTAQADADEEPSPQQVMAELIDEDSKVQVIDSTVLLGVDTFSIKLTHKCLHDSGVILPERYLKPYGLKEFTTHNFVSHILIKRNDSVILNRIVTKNDFDKVEEENLIKYGILVYPYIGKVDKEKRQITIAYSLSIPLTDVGQAVRAVINRNGVIEFKNDAPN